jgi:2-iminobutanoate/2-iminopropanoate deaminase
MQTGTRHQPVVANGLPKPAGPYSPGVVFERLLFVSGQGAMDPATGKLVGPDIEAQTEQVLKNVAAILEAAGSSLQHVIRCGVFLTDIAEFPKMNAVYSRMFGENRPARTTVQVAALPAPGLRVEIDAVAYIP